jgi:hypothetical protein
MKHYLTLTLISFLFFSCTKEENCNCGTIVSIGETSSFYIETSGAYDQWYRWIEVENNCTNNIMYTDSIANAIPDSSIVLPYIQNTRWDEYLNKYSVGDEWCNENGIW